jgi:hypothetical protein
MKFLGTVTVFVCLALAAAVMTARAQSWGRGGAYTGAGSNEVRGSGQGYYPRTGSHSCNWSVAASCAAWRNGSYSRDSVTHQLVKRFPNERWTVRVFHGDVRVK